MSRVMVVRKSSEFGLNLWVDLLEVWLELSYIFRIRRTKIIILYWESLLKIERERERGDKKYLQIFLLSFSFSHSTYVEMKRDGTSLEKMQLPNGLIYHVCYHLVSIERSLIGETVEGELEFCYDLIFIKIQLPTD